MRESKPCVVCDGPCVGDDLHNACAAVVERMIREPWDGDAAFIAGCNATPRRRWLDGSGGEQHMADGTPNPAFVPGHLMFVDDGILARIRGEMARRP